MDGGQVSVLLLRALAGCARIDGQAVLFAIVCFRRQRGERAVHAGFMPASYRRKIQRGDGCFDCIPGLIMGRTVVRLLRCCRRRGR